MAIFFPSLIWYDSTPKMIPRKFLERSFVLSENLSCSQDINEEIYHWTWITMKKSDMDSELQSEYQNSCVMPCCDKHCMVLGKGETVTIAWHYCWAVTCLCLFLPHDWLDLAANRGQGSCPGRRTAAAMAAIAFSKLICLLSRYCLLSHCETTKISPWCRFAPLAWDFINRRSVLKCTENQCMGSGKLSRGFLGVEAEALRSDVAQQISSWARTRYFPYSQIILL